MATSCKELTHWKRLWCWEGLGAGGEGDDRGWDGWMASLTQWTWVWVNSGSWWWTGSPGMLLFMGSQIVGHNWATELNWTKWYPCSLGNPFFYSHKNRNSFLSLGPCEAFPNYTPSTSNLAVRAMYGKAQTSIATPSTSGCVWGDWSLAMERHYQPSPH